MKKLAAGSLERGVGERLSVGSRQFSAPGGGGCLSSATGHTPHATRHSVGFTLIELLVVVAVIAILAGITLAALGGINQKGARDQTRAEIAAIVNALERYKSQNDMYPAPSGSNLPYAAISAFMPQRGSDVGDTNISDPYGNTYLYRFPGTRNIATFDVWSAGQDTNASATNDDIGNW